MDELTPENRDALKNALPKYHPKEKPPVETKVQYMSEMLVAFVDVLGVTDKIRQESKLAEEVVSDMKKLREHLDNTTRRLGINSTPNAFLVVSDSIIVVCETKRLKEFIRLIAEIQRYCLSRERPLLVRGGISKGGVCIEEGSRLIIGEAYLNALDLEKDIAEYPRMVISETLIEEMNPSHIHRSHDIVPCLDFIEILKNETDIVNELTDNRVRSYLDNEWANMAKKHDEKLRIRKKHGWMMNYLESKGVLK